MNADMTVLLLIIIAVTMWISWHLTFKFNEMFIGKYGQQAVSYLWAGVCGFAGAAAVTSFGNGDKSRFIVLAAAAALTVVSMRKCRERALSLGADEESAKKAMWVQFIAPLGLVGIYLAFAISRSSGRKGK